MDAPFEKKEDFAALNKGLMERGDAAVKALRFYEQQLLHRGDLSIVEAIDLAGNFLAARLEVDINISDADSLALDEEQARFINENREVIEKERRRRGEIEAAIRDAQTGNYRELKNVLRVEVERISKSSSSTVDKEDWRRLPGALTILIGEIPDTSNHHFGLPFPAYLDSRFNPSGGHLPPRKTESAD